jgi:hypothetical protein
MVKGRRFGMAMPHLTRMLVNWPHFRPDTWA